MLSTLLALCERNLLVTSGFLSQRQQTFDVFFVVSLNKLLNKQLSRLWFEMPWCSCNLTVKTNFSKIFPKLAREHVIRNAGWTQWEIMRFYSSGINILFFGHINKYGYVVKCHYKAIWYDMIFHAYSFTSKLWGVSCEYFRENWMCQIAPHYIYTIWCLLHWMLRAIDWNYNIYMYH